MREFIKDLAAVLKKHKGGLHYTTDDDGVHLTVGNDWDNDISIGWPSEGNIANLEQILKNS